MLDLKWIRENPEAVRKGLDAKFARIDLDELLSLDQERRAFLKEVEDLKAQKNQASEEIAQLKKTGQSAEDRISSVKTTSLKIAEIDAKVGDVTMR